MCGDVAIRRTIALTVTLSLLLGVAFTLLGSAPPASAKNCPEGYQHPDPRVKVVAKSSGGTRLGPYVAGSVNSRCIRKATSSTTSNRHSRGSDHRSQKQPGDCDQACAEAAEKYEQWQAEDNKAMAQWKAAIASCLSSYTVWGTAGLSPQQACAAQHPQPKPRHPNISAKMLAAAQAAPPPPPDPEVLAYQAVTRLHIPRPTPQIGPSPNINPWKIAVVGYPLWLWTTGPDPITTAVTLQGVSLTLTARRTRAMFDMGERVPATDARYGRPVVCATTTPWTRAVKPAQPSPTCGYVYSNPSRTSRHPAGTYTITETDQWTVTWVAAGAAAGTGTIDLGSTGTTTLPVGELQTVRRR